MNIMSFLKQKWAETNKVKLIESTIGGILFGVFIIGWLHLIFVPIDDYLKIHTLENTDQIVIFGLLGFIITSILAGLYLIRFVEYYIIKLSLICYKALRN